MVTNREIVESAMPRAVARKVWSATYLPALPLTPQDFELSGVLPAVMYMARNGNRRGAGTMKATYGAPAASGRVDLTIESIARVLSGEDDVLAGFNTPVGQIILGDILLTWCLENTNRTEGQKATVARVFPTHFFASWVDLPESVAHLRGVPELVIAALASQENGEHVERPKGDQTRPTGFPVGVPPSNNPLLRVLGKAVATSGNITARTADRLDEGAAHGLGIDELLMTRLAGKLGAAPLPLQGGVNASKIPNRRPANPKAVIDLRDDLMRFIRHYDKVPRQTFTELLECGLVVGLSQLLLRSARVILHLAATGDALPDLEKAQPWELFVDCSVGRDRTLRWLAEDSMRATLKQFEQLPRAMMVFRLLDEIVRVVGADPGAMMREDPDPSRLLEFLAGVHRGTDDQAFDVQRLSGQYCNLLRSELEGHAEEDPSRVGVAELLRADGGGTPVERLAEALCELMGDRLQRANYLQVLDSSLGAARRTGLVDRRTVRGQSTTRSAVMRTPMLDYLVHLHLAPSINGRPPRQLSLRGFLDILRSRHGLCIDAAPNGTNIPAAELSRNKALLEGRLRDLGVLVTVNDAEDMKTLRSRHA